MTEKTANVSPRSASILMTFRRCDLPPVSDALVLGRRAPVGSNGVVRALQAMSPGMVRLIRLEHPVIESVLVRESDLRKVPEEMLVRLLVEQASPIMDETDALNVDIDLELKVQLETRIPPEADR